jgi:hypothetical protein
MPGTVQYYKTGIETLKKKPLAHMRIDQIDERVIETTQFDGADLEDSQGETGPREQAHGNI